MLDACTAVVASVKSPVPIINMSSKHLLAKFQALAKIRSEIFGTNFNPDGARTGAKVLRKKLVGPTIANYYNNPDMIKFKHLKKLFPQFSFVNEDEEYRLTMVAAYVLFLSSCFLSF